MKLEVEAVTATGVQLLLAIYETVKGIEMNQAALVVVVQTVTEKLVKIGDETQTLLNKIDELNAQIANLGDVSPELQAAADALTAQAQVVDDKVADAVPAPVEAAPVEDAPVESAPAEAPPADPVAETPAEPVPADAAPADAAPVDLAGDAQAAPFNPA